jgi:hypothetical protein
MNSGIKNVIEIFHSINTFDQQILFNLDINSDNHCTYDYIHHLRTSPVLHVKIRFEGGISFYRLKKTHSFTKNMTCEQFSK